MVETIYENQKTIKLTF